MGGYGSTGEGDVIKREKREERELLVLNDGRREVKEPVGAG